LEEKKKKVASSRTSPKSGGVRSSFHCCRSSTLGNLATSTMIAGSVPDFIEGDRPSTGNEEELPPEFAVLLWFISVGAPAYEL
jgi:hypothetical protein